MLGSLRILVIGGCDSLICLLGSVRCLPTLEDFCIIEGKKLDLIIIEEEKIQPLSLRVVIFEELLITLALPESL
jgi:hypothetical protein